VCRYLNSNKTPQHPLNMFFARYMYEILAHDHYKSTEKTALNNKYIHKYVNKINNILLQVSVDESDSCNYNDI